MHAPYRLKWAQVRKRGLPACESCSCSPVFEGMLDTFFSMLKFSSLNRHTLPLHRELPGHCDLDMPLYPRYGMAYAGSHKSGKKSNRCNFEGTNSMRTMKQLDTNETLGGEKFLHLPFTSSQGLV